MLQGLNKVRGMQKLFVLALVYVGFAGNSLAQENFIPNQWWLQRSLINPAASGIDGKLNAAIGMRLVGNSEEYAYYLGNDYYGRIDGRLSAINSGIGFSYYTNNPAFLMDTTADYLSRQRFALNYNYQFRFENNDVLSIGFTVDVIRNYWNLSWLPPGNPNDPTLPPRSGTGNDMNMGFGALYQSQNWHIGLSLVPSINLVDEENLSIPTEVIYLTAAGTSPLDDRVAIEGGLLLSTDVNDYYGVYANTKLWLDKAYYLGLQAGVTNQTTDSFDLLLGLTFWKNLSMHYSYSFQLSDFSNSANRQIIGLQYIITD